MPNDAHLTDAAAPKRTHTLTRHDYLSDEVYAIERDRLFHGGWMLAGRGDALRRGNRHVIELAGESILLTRDLDGGLHALANVCRHRGARLCEQHSDSGQGSMMCPYHAWTYSLDGRLIATPHLDDSEVDKATLPLWQYHVREWQGFVFVSLAADPPAFDTWMHQHCADLLALERYQFGDLVVGATRTCDIAANWKIVIENYQECLHCTRVHPELVDLVPIYRTGWVTDHSRDDGGVTLARGYSMAAAESALPLLPGIGGLDATSYYGGTIFPNGFIDVTGTCAIVSTLYPKGPGLTTMTMQFLFAPEVVAADGFDPSGVVDFNVLVADQDNVVCESVQRGVSSKALDHGVLTPKDSLVIDFVQHYLAARGPLS